jgi:Tol biopolymer transport system component
MSHLFYKILLLSFLGFTHPKETLLTNIEQLTTPALGFEKAGEAYFSPDAQTISFQAVPKGETGYQIYTMDLATKDITQISQGAKTCTCSYFRPDGQKIIFAASPQDDTATKGTYKWDLTPYMNIYEADVEGTNPVALTQGPAYHAECAYSPDGSQIVYASNEDGSMNIYIMQSDGTGVKQLTHTTHCYNGGPFFSPDGTKIIYRADVDVPDLLQLFVMNTDGTNVVQLTNNKHVNWAPYWYPLSDDIIAYTTSVHGHHNYEIYLLSISTGEQYRVTHDPAFDGLPSFSPDGTKILWTSKRGEDNTAQVFMADFTLPEGWPSNTSNN